MAYYGLSIVGIEEAMLFSVAEQRGLVTDELLEQFADTMQDCEFCIYGTFHCYKGDH